MSKPTCGQCDVTLDFLTTKERLAGYRECPNCNDMQKLELVEVEVGIDELFERLEAMENGLSNLDKKITIKEHGTGCNCPLCISHRKQQESDDDLPF